MDKEKLTDKLDKTSHKIDDWVENTAEKHGFPKWKVWLSIGIAALAVVGAAKVLGWL